MGAEGRAETKSRLWGTWGHHGARAALWHHSFTRRKLSDTGAPLESRGAPQRPPDSPEHARLPSTAGERSRRRTCTNRHGRQAGWAAPRTATSRRLRRRVGGPAARPGGRVREPHSPHSTAEPRTRDDAPRRMVRSADTTDGHLPTEPAACERQGQEQEPPCTNAIRASPIAHLDGQAPPAVKWQVCASDRYLVRAGTCRPTGGCCPPRRSGSQAVKRLDARNTPGWSQSRASCGDLPSGTGPRFGTRVGAGYRAGALASTHPVNRSQLDRRLELAARSRTIAAPIGARFGHGPETAISCGDQARRERDQWTNRKISPGCRLAVVGWHPAVTHGVGPGYKPVH